MGQNYFDCQGQQDSLSDFIKKQMKIYIWRANPNFNSFVSRVSFQDSQNMKQEQKFNELIGFQNANNYLQIDKFRKQVMQLPENHQQIIIFQKYYGCLSRFAGLLSLEQSVYTLHNLLLGYEELNKMFDKIVVDGNCCFVTNDGCVRAWINPNFKSNEAWTGPHGERLLQNEAKTIITQIINLVQIISSKSQKIGQFFWTIRTKINSITIKGYEFVQARRIINQFSFSHHIQSTRGLQDAIQRLRMASQPQRQIKTITHPVITYPTIIANKENIYLSTIGSYNPPASASDSLLIKSKSLEHHFFKSPPLANTKPSFQKYTETKNIVMLMPSIQQSASSHIVQNCNSRIQPFGKHSEIVDRKSYRLNQIKQIPSPHNNYQYTKQPSNGILKNSSMARSKLTQQLSPSRSSAQSSSESSCINQQRQLMQQKEENKLTVFPRQQVALPQKNQSKRQPFNKKNTMEISLIQAMQHNTPNKEMQVFNDSFHKAKTPGYSAQKIARQNNFQRSWITTKTITRLISENQNSSLENSIKQSPDSYNNSSYSGALTQMGRDAEIFESGRNSTEQKISIKL